MSLASSVGVDGLLALARKYEALAKLRRERAAGGEVPVARVFRALAREFPGCLNELDTLPLEDIDARAAALVTAAATGAVEPWMAWLSDYHRLLRAALALKPKARRARDGAPGIDDATADALARDASRTAGVDVDRAFVRGVAAPPGGRLVALVFDEIARRHRADAATIKRALFPRSRR